MATQTAFLLIEESLNQDRAQENGVPNRHAAKNGEAANGDDGQNGDVLTHAAKHVESIPSSPSRTDGFTHRISSSREDILDSGHLVHNEAASQRATKPQSTNAYLVGGGIASLAAAVTLIQDAHVPAAQIHILESASVASGSMDGAGNPQDGYRLRGGRMLNISYSCLYDLLSKAPSLSDPKKTVPQEIVDFNAIPENKTHSMARLVAKGATGPEIMDVKQLGLKAKDRLDLVYVGDYPWHSAVEFRRYLHIFIQEFPRINTLAGIDRTPLNQYDSIILPIKKYLKEHGVDFKFDMKVKRLSFAESSKITVEEIHLNEKGAPGHIHIEAADIVSTLLRPAESAWLSFTVTLHDPSFFERLTAWSSNTLVTGALVTFKDSAWLMSIVVPKQPHFLNQPSDVQVFWGYGLFPFTKGNIVPKTMAECTGEEILTELLGLLNFPQHPTVESATTIPCMMHFITSQFLTRKLEDRPKVIPDGSTNLVLLGQYVEIAQGTVFTVDYSVRGAQMAVFGLMGLNKKPKPFYHGDHDVRVLVEALKMLLT